ncbi:MAG: NUDIX-like domain-containing protein, partial [Myxococcota bacterium]
MSEIVFSGNPLDRAEERRRDAAWLRERLAEDATRVLPVWKLSPLVRTGDAPRLAWATPALLDGRDAQPEPVFLGVAGGVAHFAADLSDRPDPLAEFGFEGVAHFPDLRAIAGLLSPGDAGIAAQARQVVDWHARHGFC